MTPAFLAALRRKPAEVIAAVKLPDLAAGYRTEAELQRRREDAEAERGVRVEVRSGPGRWPR
jgi:hypothetical protein